MAMIDVPSWITVKRGRAPILLLAPHGGRRHDARHPGKHKVNDLLTADLTRELAASCGASMIINESLDRNQLDLNRLSQVRRGAPWMIALLTEMLGAMVSEAGHATVLVVHGWNVTQAACDVGVGLRERAGGLAPVRQDSATVSEAFVAARLRPLQRAATAAGITVTIGTRYPAAHPDNLLQMFRGVADRDSEDPCPIAALCRSRSVEAAQFELAIPLRWPGPRRDRFLALIAEVFTPGVDRNYPRVDQPSTGIVLRSSRGRVTRRRGLQFVAADMLVMTSIDAGDAGGIAGRLIISQDHDRLALFTGELGDPSVAWTIPPLIYEEFPGGGARVAYEGPLVGFPTLTPFLDLERGLAGGRLIEAHVDLTFHADSGDGSGSHERFGDVRGEVLVDGRRHSVVTRGVATKSGVLAPQRLPSCRLTLFSSQWGSLILSVDPDTPLAYRLGSQFVGAMIGTASANASTVGVRARCDLRLSSTAGSIALDIVKEDRRPERLTGILERLIPVRRAGREDAVVETTFALIRVDGSYVGWLEVTVATDLPGPAT